MIKSLKSNKIVVISLIIICLIFILNPAIYIQSCLNGLSVWAFKVLPVLFPFFVFTRLIVNLSELNTNPLDKLFSKIYRVPKGSLLIFFLSVMSGYPMGAKLISSMYENDKISHQDAIKMLSFCSVSGPMFIVGTVGVSIFNNYTAGIIILLVNIIASLINGLFFRGKKQETKPVFISHKDTKMSLADCVIDSLNSILIVGAYIVLSFLLIDFIKNLTLFQGFLNTICGVFPIENINNVVNAIISGSFEITRGAIDINATNISVCAKTIITCASIGFGGISVMLQNTTLLKKLNISIKTIIKQKLLQGLICLIISIPICILFL